MPQGSDMDDSDISNATPVDPTGCKMAFTADVPGKYILNLVVSDGTLISEPDTMTVTVVIDENGHAPVADAGDDLVVDTGRLGPGECAELVLKAILERFYGREASSMTSL